MRRKIGRIGGTTLYLHPATLLFAVYALGCGYGPLLFCGMLSIVLHECAHALAGRLLGCAGREMEITPFGCMLRMEDEERASALHRLLIVLAGPLCTLLLCLLLVCLTKQGLIAQDTGRLWFACNAAILVMNLLPALPLDGGRLAGLLLGVWLSPLRVRGVMRWSGRCIGLSLVALNVLVCLRMGGLHFSLGMSGCFLLYAACVSTTSAAMAEIQELMERKSRLEMKGLARGELLAVMADMPLYQAAAHVRQGRYTMLLVLEKGSMRMLGILCEEKLLAAYLNAPGKTVREALEENGKIL